VNWLGDRAAALVDGTLDDWVRIADGNLSTVYRLKLRDGRIMVVKVAATAANEAAMLKAIRGSGAPFPEVFGSADDLVVMEEVRSDGALCGSAWASLATSMSMLHEIAATNYGWPIDHAFGAVAIPNDRCDSWPIFWADRRLRCHLSSLEPALAERVERVAETIGEYLPAHPKPSLLHGDLWDGNILVSGREVAALIDPACYYGHREVDVAMLKLFRDPPMPFFAALDLERGWRQRLPLYRLWPALVHLRLFGSIYAGLVSRTLDEIGA